MLYVSNYSTDLGVKQEVMSLSLEHVHSIGIPVVVSPEIP